MIRLQKFLSGAGVASRRKAEELILNGKIKINGKVIRELGTKIDEDSDKVECEEIIVKPAKEKIYIALNKPYGYISSSSNKEGKSILGLVKIKKRIYPVGRLDKDSSGLILLTNDGEFANNIAHPRHKGEKEYFIVLDRDLNQEDLKKIQRGMTIAGKKLQPAIVISAKNKSCRLILKEGINRQLRRMFGHLGYTVVKLKRIRIGKLELKDLKEGEWKKIKKEDVE